MDSDIIYYGSCIFFEFQDKLLSSSGYLDDSLALSKSDPLRSVFRVIPQSNYTVQDILLSELKDSKGNMESFVSKFKSHKRNLEGEISTNISTSLSYKSQPITYGSQIQLQHWHSKKILTLSKEKHDKHRDKFKLFLSDFGSANSSFSINSAFKYQEEGSAYIRPGSKVVLTTELKNCEKLVFCDYIDENESSDNEKNKDFFEVVGSLESKIAFTISLFNQENFTSNKICCGDFVQLIHSEENSCFTAVRNLYDKSIIEPKFSQNLQNGNSIWIIENLDNKFGGELKTGQVYTIKNLSSGFYLVMDFSDDLKTTSLAFKKEKDDSKWKIEHDKAKEPVESERFYRIVYEESNFTLAAAVDSSISGDDKYLPTLLEDELNVSYFRIKKTNDYFLSTTLFLVTSQEFLNNFLEKIQKFMENQEEDFKNCFIMLQRCLKEIKHFCLNKMPKLISIDVPEGQIDKLKQNTLRDLKLISTLTDILKFFISFKSKSIKKEEVRDVFIKELEKSFKKIFSLISVVCLDNPENQEEAFEYIETYCKFIDSIPAANSFLISLFRDNEKLLSRLASKSCNERNILVSSYINALRKNTTKERKNLLKLLATICVFEEESISPNQELIHEFLFKNPDNYSKITIPVSSDDGKNIELILPHESGCGEVVVKLDQCYLKASHTEKIQYFTSLLNLFAGMCTGKNFVNYSSISVWLTRKLVVSNMWNDSLGKELRAAFCRLVKSLYVDCFSKIESRRIEIVKILPVSKMERMRTKKLIKIDIKMDFKDIFDQVLVDEEDKKNYDQEVFENLVTGIIKYFDELFSGKNQDQSNKEINEESHLSSKSGAVDQSIKRKEDPVYNKLTLELLNLVFKLIKLEIIGISSEKENQFESMFKIIKSIKSILFQPDQSNPSDISQSAINFDTQLDKVMIDKERDANKNEIVLIEGEHLLNYLKSMSSFHITNIETSSLRVKCKIKALKIFDYLIDWIIDRCVTKILRILKIVDDEKSSIENILKLQDFVSVYFPEVYDVNKLSENLKNNQEKQDLNEVDKLFWIDLKFIEELLKLFSSTKNYIMQNLILRILMRCFSLRRQMLRALNKLNLITNSKDAKVFNWVKVNIIIFTELVDQADIWISSDKSEKNNEQGLVKYKKTIEILKSIKNILLEHSTIKDQKVKLGTLKSISSFRQNLMIHLNLHVKIIYFIRDHLHQLSEVYDDFQTDEERKTRKRHLKLFRLCFGLLTDFVRGNKDTQKILHRYLQIFIRDLKMKLKQMQLIVEIFRNNLELCNQITEKFLHFFINLIETEGRQQRFLELFPVIQRADEKVIHENQRLVFKVLAQNPNYKFLLYIDENYKFVFESNNNHFNPNYKDMPVKYHCKVIETMACCAMKPSENIYLIEAKCQKIFQVSMIFKALDDTELKITMSQSMRIPLLKLLYHTYFESDKGLDEMFRNPYFMTYIKKHTEITDGSPKFIEVMIDILSKYCSRFTGATRPNNETTEDLIIIEKYLKTLPHSFDGFSDMQKTIKNLEGLISCFKINFLIPEVSLEKQISQNATNAENEFKENWEKLKSELIKKDTYKKYLKEEKASLLSMIVNIDKYLQTRNFPDFLEQIVSYIRQAHHKNSSVQILNNSINFIITILSKNIKKEEEKNQVTKQFIQNTLCSFGLVKIILSLMCEKDINEKVYNRLVHLSTEMLDGGNTKVQNEFYKYFITSEHSEQFFKKIYFYLNAQKVTSKKVSVVYKKQSNNLYKILKLLQLLCENHNLDLQTYLRYQEKSNNSYNIIEAVEMLYERLTIERSESSFLVFSKCLDTLTEMIQGPCEKNQEELTNSKFLDTSNNFLKIDQTKPDSKDFEPNADGSERMRDWMIVHLKYKLSITLLSLLEMNRNEDIISKMSRIFEKQTINDNLKWIYKSFEDNGQTEFRKEIFGHYEGIEKINLSEIKNDPKKIADYMCIIEMGFNLFHLKKYLKDYDNRAKELPPDPVKPPVFEKKNLITTLKHCGEKLAEVFKKIKSKIKKEEDSKKKTIKKYKEFFENHTGRVEISYKEKLILIYFILRPEALFLTKEVQEEFHKTVDRSSEKSKLQHLQLETKTLRSKIKKEQWLIIHLRKYPVISMVIANIHLWSYLTFTLTILLNYILIASYHMPYKDDVEPQLCLKTDKYAECTSQASKTETSNLFLVLGILHFIFSGLVFFFHALKMGPGIFKSNYKKYVSKQNSSFRSLRITVSVILTALNPMICYYFLTGIVSLIAVVQRLYGLYCIQMLDIIFRFPSLLNVVKSIYYSRKALVLTFVFNIVIIYYFTLWGYSRLNEFYGGQCPNLRVCMAKTYDRGLKLGMGWVFLPMEPGTYEVERFFFENLFYIVIFTCMMNFIKGIIYDAFFVLRDESSLNLFDRENHCFICGLDRESIEKGSGNTFAYHTQSEHNMWNYAFYMMYVLKKTQTELTSIESYVKDMLKTNNILWFPQKNSVSIKKEEEPVDSMTKEIEELKLAVLKVQEEINEINQLISDSEGKTNEQQ